MSAKKKTIDEKLSEYYSDNASVNKKLDILKSKIDEDNYIYKWRHFFQYLSTFIEGEKDIPDFYIQFEKLINFYNENPSLKSSYTLEICKLKYGDTLGKIKYEERQNKNPFKNHGGRLSPFHKGSVNYSEESIKKANEHRSYNTRIDYYLNKGLSLKEAKEKLSKRQTTFSLEKCIEKYGKDGLKIWKKRQKKWQKTLNSKSEEEKKIISFLKASGISRIDKNKKCSLYYIHIYNNDNNFWKIGITTKTLEERLRLYNLNKHGLKYKIIFVKEFNNYVKAHKLEHDFLRKYLNNRIKIDIEGFKSGECFNKDIFEGKYEF